MCERLKNAVVESVEMEPEQALNHVLDAAGIKDHEITLSICFNEHAVNFTGDSARVVWALLMLRQRPDSIVLNNHTTLDSKRINKFAS